jgi:hypothetical protein
LASAVPPAAVAYVNHQRLWADLLSSVSLGFNLFGDLAGDLGLADRAVHTW